MLYLIITDKDKPLLSGEGQVCYFPSRYDAAQTANEWPGSRIVTVAERQAEKD